MTCGTRQSHSDVEGITLRHTDLHFEQEVTSVGIVYALLSYFVMLKTVNPIQMFKLNELKTIMIFLFCRK